MSRGVQDVPSAVVAMKLMLMLVMEVGGDMALSLTWLSLAWVAEKAVLLRLLCQRQLHPLLRLLLLPPLRDRV